MHCFKTSSVTVSFVLLLIVSSSRMVTLHAFQLQHQQCSHFHTKLVGSTPTLSSSSSSSSSYFPSFQRRFLPSFTNNGGHHHYPCYFRQHKKDSTTQLYAFSVSTALAVADTFWRTCPYTAAALTGAIKGSVADLVAQLYFPNNKNNNKDEQRVNSSTSTTTTSYYCPVPNTSSSSTAIAMSAKPNYNDHHHHNNRNNRSTKKTDWKRNMAYAIYGSIYQGMIQEYIFNHLYPMLFGFGTDVRTVALKVIFNLLIHAPLITIPISYIVKATIYHQPFHTALKKYIHDIQYNGLLMKFMCVWGPVQSLVFSVIPVHLRVTFIAMVSFFWMIILSSTAAKPVAVTVAVAVEK